MHVVDKSNWRKGEWTSEPDQVDFVTDEGYHGLIVRHTNSGHLCGYVGVDENHPEHGKDYDDVGANVHGGLTYAGQLSAELGAKSGLWYLGFDCAHFDDLCPGGWRAYAETGAYRNIDFVRREVAGLSRQLSESANSRPVEEVCITLTLKQAELLCEALSAYTDCGPQHYGWASSELSELRGIVDDAICAATEGSSK